MAGPVAKHLRDLWKKLLGRTEQGTRARPHIAIVAIGLVVLVLGWFVGQAWVTARNTGVSTQAVARPDLAAPNLNNQPAATASLNLSNDTITQSGELVLSGNGFQPFESVVIGTKDSQSDQLRELTRVNADWHGTFLPQSITLPDWLMSGTQTIEALGERSGIRGVASLYVRAKDRWVNISTYGLKQSEKIGFVVGGFEPGEDVNVYLAEGQDMQPDDSATPVLTLTADKAGNTEWMEWPIPLVKAGTYSLMFRGASGGQALSRNIVINALTPMVDLSPWSGPPGSHVELNGQGFVPGEQVGVYLGDSTEAVLMLDADEAGNFWGAGPIALPYEARGSYRVTFVGEDSHALVSRTFGVVPPKPWVELSTYAGFAGTSVFFSGGGFASGEQVTIHIGTASGPTISVGKVNEQGYYEWIGPVNVPPSADEEVTFVLVGERSQTAGSAKFTVLTPWVPGAASERP